MLIIDMDTPVYRAAGAAQKKLPDGSIELEPDFHAFHNITKFVDKILGKFPEHDFRMYLTSSPDVHYRYELYPDYKAHRKGKDKPVHYQATRDFILKKYDSRITVVEGMEADDAIAIHMSENKWKDDDKYEEVNKDTLIGIYIDKDIHQVPGWRYQYDKDRFYYILEQESLVYFYTQMFKGDSADNVKNLVKYSQWKPELKQLTVAKDTKEMYNILYRAACEKIKNKNRDEIEELLKIRGQLLWLQRYKGDMWQIPQ